MITLEQFFQSQDESIMSRLMGISPAQKRNPLYDHPQFGAAFKQLVQKNQGDEQAAEAEIRKLAQSPVGRYQLQRMGAQMSPTSDHDPAYPQRPNPRNQGGAAMMQPQPY
jgi:hypothetical protein